MGRLSDEEKKEFSALMADPKAATKARIVLFGLLDEEDERKKKADAEAAAKNPPSWLDELFGSAGR